ncbi:hypothetical protein LAZ67_3001652, partial [Cordylochernes scorpioides]
MGWKPHQAEHEPGRLGSDSQTVAEIYAENQIQDENSRIAIASGNYANLAIDRKHANFAAACVADVMPSTSGALTAATNWAEQIEASESGGDGYTEVKHKRRRRDSPGRPVEQRSSGIATSGRTGRNPAKSTTCGAERITVGNLPFFVDDAAVIEALKPYGDVTSIVPIRLRAGRYTFTDGRREAFILLKEGIALEKIPTRVVIRNKGNVLLGFHLIVKCSRCGRQGHRRSNCPINPGRASNNGQPQPAPLPPGASSTLSRQQNRPTPAAPALKMEETPSAPPPVTPAPPLQAPEGPVGPRPAGSQHPEPPPARPDLVAPRNPLPAQKTLGPAAPTPDVEMSIVEETSASSTSSAKNATRFDLDAFIERHPSVSFAGTDALGLGREEVLDLLSSRTKAQRNRPLLSPPQGDALAGLIGQILDLRPGAATNLYKVLGQVKAELRTTPAAVPTPPLPAPRPAEPAPPAPHGEKTTPDMATPPPLLSPRFIDERWREAHDIIDDLGREPYSEHLSELKLSEGDITDNIICPEDREPLLRRLSTRRKNILAEIISAAIERARDIHPFAQSGEDGYTEVKNKRRRRDSPGRPDEQRSTGIATSGRTGANPRSRPPAGRATEVQVIRATPGRHRRCHSTPALFNRRQLRLRRTLPGLRVHPLPAGGGRASRRSRERPPGDENGRPYAGPSPSKRGRKESPLEICSSSWTTPPSSRPSSPTVNVTSIVPIRLRAGRYTFTDGRREALILLKEGIALEKIPTRVAIRNKGNVLPAFISYGVKCSRCGRQGHRRANCPINPRRASNNGQPQPATHPPGASSTVSRQPNPSTPAAPALQMEETPSVPPPVIPAPSLRAPEGPVGPRSANPQHPEPPPARQDFVAPRNPLPAQKTLGPAAPTPDVEMSIVEETSASSTSSAKNATRFDLDAFIKRHPTVSFARTDALGLEREEVLDLLSSRTKAQRNGPLLSPPQCDALAGLIRQILDLRPGAASNLYKVLGQAMIILVCSSDCTYSKYTTCLHMVQAMIILVKAELRTTPTAVSPTPPLPAPRPAEPTPPAPPGKMTTPAMATSPPPLFQLEEDLTSKRWEEAADIIYKLCNERYSGPLTDLEITEDDITDAVIYPEDREPLLRTCSTQKKNLITEIISAAIESARDSDPF